MSENRGRNGERDRRRDGSGLVVGVTASRFVACKRGVAANLAAMRAAEHDRSGSVVAFDADPAWCDLRTRLTIPFSYAFDPFEAVGSDFGPGVAARRLAHPKLDVVATGLDDVPSITRTTAVTHALAERYPEVVVDLPVGTGRPGPSLDAATTGRVDVLLVTASCVPAALDALVRHLELLEIARVRGHVHDEMAVMAVLTGDELTNTVDPGVATERLRGAGIEVAGRLPQRWGQAHPNAGFGPTLGYAELDRDGAAIWARVTSRTVVCARHF